MNQGIGAQARPRSVRARLRAFLDQKWFVNLVLVVILANALVLGAETMVTGSALAVLTVIDHVMLGFFVLELLLRIVANGRQFFRDPWNVFDLLVVGIAVLPASESLSALRALRVLRVLRVITVVPSLRRVVDGLLRAVPGMGAVGALLVLVMYVSAVIATGLFGKTSPEYFGSLWTSLFTLFQAMTGEAWPDIARAVMETHPSAWIFFVLYILVVSFAVLNLFIAVIVNGMEEISEEERKDDEQKDHRLDGLAVQNREILAELRALRAKLDEDDDGAVA
ncbi:voltage-gated sodium channel [Promicromonospora sp. AC04]|uniref:ion transporter n=1 Tax=Promicromonospora sp. AC04 TaxID=2135723 RepID=UPI000D37B157|nr:ion transporter [Promicromonospora sp. AC04]PUB28895.1 voltage-gated sodium channel [Promicromonospora sp. AC04]